MAQWSAICIGIGWSALVALAATPAEELDRARGLFEKRDFTEAREVLLAIDRDQLNDDQKTRRDELAEELKTAINQADKARQNLEDADAAFKGNEPRTAEKLYRAVLANIYAAEAQQKRARDGLALIEKQRDLQSKLTAQPGAATRPAADQGEAPATRPSAADLSEARLQRNRMQAAQAIAEGDEAVGRGQFDIAEQRYQSALQMAPNHPLALKGLEEIRQRRAVEGQPNAIDSELARRRLRWQRAEVLLKNSEREARAALNDNDFQTARERVNAATQTLEAARHDADPPDRYTYWSGQLSALGRSIEAEQRDFQETTERERTRAARETQNQRIRQDLRDRTERVTQLMQQAVQLRKEQRYEQAISVLNEILIIDPLNERAQDMIEILQDTNVILRQKKDMKTRRDTLQKMIVMADDDLNSPILGDQDGFVKYPDEEDWRIIAKRDPFGAGISGESDSDRAARQKLSAIIPTVDFPEGTSFADVIEFLSIQGKVSIDVNWPALTLAGVERTADAGSIRLRDVKVETVLTILLENVSASATQVIDYDIVDGVIRVSTQELLASRLGMRVYDIRDLLLRVRSFRLDNQQGGALGGLGGGLGGLGGGLGGGGGFGGGGLGGGGGGFGGGGFGGGGGGFGGGGGGFGGGGGGGGSGDDDESEDERQEVIDDLIDLIINNVEPDSWEDGGGNGTVDIWNDRLIVRQTAKVHRQLIDLFRQLRASKDIQVAVESRFITMQSNFLEEIGVDLDVVLNQGNAGFDPAMAPDANGASAIVRDPNSGNFLLQPRQFTKLGFSPAAPGFGQQLTQVTALDQPYQNVGLVPTGSPSNWWSRHTTPFPVANNSLALTQQLAQSHGTGVPGSIGSPSTPAFQVFGSFLDNLQVDFLMRATKMDVHSSVMDSPRLVAFNGRSAYLNVTTVGFFVIAPGSVPVGGNGVGGGAAGGQQPGFGSAIRGRQFQITPFVSADRKYVTMEIYPIFSDFRTNSFQTANGPVQVPEIDTTEVRTYGTVPDNGTLLIGGLKQAGEVEVEAGVPVLSSLPGLKRAFTNRSRVKDERVLLMLIKPRIIIQEEQEQMAFPSLSTTDRSGL